MACIIFSQQNAGDQVTTDDKEYINAEKASRQRAPPGVIENDWQHCDGAQTINLRSMCQIRLSKLQSRAPKCDCSVSAVG